MNNNKSEIKMYELRKIKIQQLIESNFNLTLNREEESKYIIKQQESPLFRQINTLRGHNDNKMGELILVEARHNKKREDELRKLLEKGFTYNDRYYVRYGKSAAQAKDGITLFIEEKYCDSMMERSLLGLKPDKVVVSKFESYRNLISTACQTVDKKLPYIIIVDEYEKIIPNQHIRYAVDKEVKFPDKTTGEIIKFKKKVIEEGNLDIEISPFDGFGVHTKKISNMINRSIDIRKDTIAFQIRMPMMKGVSVEANFKKFYKERGVETITDVFGKKHKVKDIDCIWNTSMWKCYKDFKKAYGNDGWERYFEKVNEYKFQLGISKYNHHMDDIDHYSRLNFQYLQCMDLKNNKYLKQFKEHNKKYDILDENNWGKIINVAKYSTDLVENIIKGKKLYTMKFLGKNNSDKNDIKSKYVEAIMINDRMLKDPSIKKMLKNKLDKTITEMKYGKIYAKGFYHTVVGDIIGYLEYAGGLEVKGCLNAGEFYANTLEHGNCLSLRSPLVDPSEVHRIKLVHNDDTNKYLRHFYKKDVCMINMYDLTMQIQGGMDTDGDQVFLCNDEILVNSKINLPSVVDMSDKEMAEPKEYNKENIVDYELKSRDNRIGEITNVATSILNQYTEDEKWKKINQDNIAWLRLAQGKEIDFLKTGTRWVIPKYMRKYMQRLPYFLLYNYPKKMNVYQKIQKVNKGVDKKDKVPYNAFRSPSPMNELCDYICEWEKRKIDWDNSLENNCDLVIDNTLDLSDRDIMKRIIKIFDKYNIEFKKELDKDESSQNIVRVRDDCHIELSHELPDKHMLANYCIKSAYKSISRDKTLCWMIFGDEIIKNLRNNSDENEFRIEKSKKDDLESQEFLGKYYKLIKE